MLVGEDERRSDLEDVVLAAGAADQDSGVAQLVDNSLGELRVGIPVGRRELDADE